MKYNLDDYDCICLIGRKRVGKDTVARLIVELAANSKWTIYALARPLKESLSILTGLPIEYFDNDELKDSSTHKGICNGETPRDWMNFLYKNIITDKLKELRPDIADIYFAYHFHMIYSKGKIEQTILTDIRSPQYHKYLREKCKTLSIKIDRNVRKDNNISETDVDQIDDYDILIHNDGTIEDLKTKLCELFV